MPTLTDPATAAVAIVRPSKFVCNELQTLLRLNLCILKNNEKKNAAIRPFHALSLSISRRDAEEGERG